MMKFERCRIPLEYPLRQADGYRHRVAVAFSTAFIANFPSLDICAVVVPALLDRAQAKCESDVEQMNQSSRMSDNMFQRYKRVTVRKANKGHALQRLGAKIQSVLVS